MSGKKDLIVGVMQSLIGKVDTKDLKAIEDSFWQVSFNFSVEPITTTEVATTDGSATEMLFNYYEVCKLASGRTQETIDQYRLVVTQLCGFCHKELNTVTEDDIMVFLAEYPRVNNVKASTMNIKRKYLSSVFNFLFKHKKINDNPMACIEPIKYRKCIKVPLSDEEIEKLKTGCTRKRDLAILHLFLDTGVRISELAKINLSDVDFKNHTCKVLGKGNKERVVGFSGRTAVRLADYLSERADIKANGVLMAYPIDTPLFIGINTRKRLSKGGIREIIRRIGNQSTISRVHPHLLRATFATNAYNKGIDIGIIAEILGHSNLENVKEYVKISTVKVQQAISQIGFCA